jgi:hypothetical protein
MKNRMELRVTGERHILGHMSHMLENCIRAIKLGSKFLTMIYFEGCFLIRLKMKKHMVPFNNWCYE